MSVIALLALLCFPVFAQAECVSSSCVQYTEAIPNSEGENPSTPHKHPPVAKAADNGGASAPTGKAGKSPSDETDESSENESSKEGGAPATGNGGGMGQGKAGGSANSGPTSQAQHGGQNVGTPASHTSSSSSPLVPILIGIAVLAAISVGAVMYRQRRQRRGPTASAPSPKAS
jgi:cobalamin biosynthesis Mg chelatase CobN